MRTKLLAHYDSDKDDVWYAVAVGMRDTWAIVGTGGKPDRFDSLAAAERERARLRKFRVPSN